MLKVLKVLKVLRCLNGGREKPKWEGLGTGGAVNAGKFEFF